jgi:iron(III) transport system substrate-binding protein
MQITRWRLALIWAPAVLAGISLAGCGERSVPEVVVYTSLDQTFSEPILRDFEQQTGVRVKAVYDTEATKTTGLVNRLLAEKANPQADVFWNSEVIRTLVLKNKGVLAPYASPAARSIPAQFKDSEGYWTGFAARSRVLIANTALVPEAEMPASIFELTEGKWRGAVGLAYPLFGTTATHAAALFAELGPDEAQSYFRRLKDNDVVIVDGNATAKDRVANGQLKVAFTDTDDANLAVQAGAPVKMIFPDREGIGTLLIPNTVALVANGPHSDQGRALIDYLLSEEVERRLSSSGSLQMPVRDSVKVPAEVPKIQETRPMQVDWEQVAESLEPSATFLQQLFVR